MKRSSSYIDKVSNTIIKNKRREYDCSLLWSTRVVVSMIITAAFLVVIKAERTSQFWILTYLFGIPIEFMTTAVLVYLPLGQRIRSEEITYLDGRPVKGNLIKKIVYYIFSFGPLYLCCVFRFNFNPIASIFLTPIVLIVVQISAFVSPPASSVGFSVPSMTPSEIQAVSVRMSQGGISSKTISSVVSVPGMSYQSLMTLTPSDWSAIGHRVGQAGINIMSK